MIEIQNLNKSYGKNIVLKDINLSFEKSKVYGIVGENGAGKTTLFKCIAGLESFNGTIISEFDNLKDNIGYLETTPHTMSYITGWEYLKLMCISKGIKTENFEAQNIFNLPLNEYITSYSTGMKKKISLMGLLLRKNQVVILDEPFNGVDIQSNMVIVELIKELQHLQKTVLISSHIFSTLNQVCDEIKYLDKGSIRSYNKEQFDLLEQLMKEKFKESTISKLEL